jgi:hypothetical protein
MWHQQGCRVEGFAHLAKVGDDACGAADNLARLAPRHEILQLYGECGLEKGMLTSPKSVTTHAEQPTTLRAPPSTWILR